VNCFSDPERASCAFPCLDSVDTWIGDWSNIAAVIVEPVLSAGGMLIPPPGYLKLLREMAHKNGALFIVDEAQTGFGRTGKWFAIEGHDAPPDILTLSKSVGNGFPVAAVATTAEIADAVVAKGLWNLSSHQSDPVSAAAVSAVIDLVREEGLLDRAREAGEYFMRGLRQLSGRNPAIANVRGEGLMIGFDLVPGGESNVPEFVNDFMFGCRRRGVHLTYGFGGVNFRIIPPLVITHAEIDFALQVFEESLLAVQGNPDSKRKDWPRNPQTSRLFERNHWKRLMDFCWRSSPADFVEKGKELIQQRLGRRS
jgi:2,2-dialkylglycine decarboxylase (pyruvate)